MHPIFDKTMKAPFSQKPKGKFPDQTYLPVEADENSSWEWYDPPEDSPPVKFCLDTSLHGLQYLGQRKRHLCERIFWLVAFSSAVVTATILISEMWSSYRSSPIVTVFAPSEKTIHEIPFPGVTICNVNNVQKSKFEALKSKAEEGMVGNIPDEEYLTTLAFLAGIYHICEGNKTFLGRFASPYYYDDFEQLKTTMDERRSDFLPFLNITSVLRNVTQPCKTMILHCVWLDRVVNCTDFFQEIETDYGYCCSFNIIPISLLLKDVNDSRDDSQRVQEWAEADIEYDNLILNSSNLGRKYPLRQQYPGRSAGLSILLNPDLDEYYCTNTDSDGFVASLNVPLDFPRMTDNGIAIKPNSEIFMNVRPEITMSDSSIQKFSLDKRDCYFSDERVLPHYSKYTTSNCIDECIAYKTRKECGCKRYYMPQGKDDQLCRPQNYSCTNKVREEVVQKGLGQGKDQACKRCYATCTEIVYHAETTTLGIRPGHVKKLLAHNSEMYCSIFQGSNSRDLSILHVYFSVDSVYPRLRMEATSIVNLISSTGGLLGLFMGFSMLSLLEIIYHATIRLFCNSYRERCKDGKNGNLPEDNCRNSVDVNTITLCENKFASGKINGFLSKVYHRGYVDAQRANRASIPGKLFKSRHVNQEDANTSTEFIEASYDDSMISRPSNCH